MSTSNTIWIAVATHPNAEGQAVQNLKRQGYQCYCPRTRVTRRHARRSETVERPFFPGYLFVRLDRTRDQWRPIMHSRGVRTVVRFGEKLGIVPQGVIERLLAREDYGGLMRLPPAAERLEVGQRVSLNGTLFDDFMCTVQSIEPRDRVCVLLEVMQHAVKMVVPSENVAVV